MRFPLCAALFALVVFASSCGGGGGHEPRPQTTSTFAALAEVDPTAAFGELEQKYHRARFQVLYTTDEFGTSDPQELLWTQDGSSWRTDAVKLGKQSVGITDIYRAGRVAAGETPTALWTNKDSCGWQINRGSTKFQVDCIADGGDRPAIDVLLQTDRFSIQAAGQRSTLDVPTTCFDINANFRGTSGTNGTICFSDEGIPLEVRTRGLPREVVLIAKEIRATPTDDRWLLQIIDAGRRTERVTNIDDISASELSLPDTPLTRRLIATLGGDDTT